MSHDYQIYCRESNQHRPGHYALLIDGVDTDVTLDAAQFMPKATEQALLASPGLSGADLALTAGEIANEMARFCLERKVSRLKAGRFGQGVHAAPVSYFESERRESEAKAVEKFLNRGKLKGLSVEQRKELFKSRVDRKRDNYAEWLERRAKKVADCKEQIAHWEAEAVRKNPKAEKRLRALRAELAALESPVQAASHGYQYAYTRYLTANVNYSSDTIKFVLCMTNTDADTLRDAVDATNDLALDEFDGSSYSSGGVTLSGVAVAVDDANDRCEVDCTDPTPVSYGAGTRSIEGILVIKFITSLALSLPLHFLDFSTNKTPDGSSFALIIDAEGFLQVSG